MCPKAKVTQVWLLYRAIQVGGLVLILTVIGCNAVRDQGQLPMSSSSSATMAPLADRPVGAQASPSQQISGPFVGSEKIMADLKAAGFSVADPNVHWGVTIAVDAEQATGGFSAEAEEGVIILHWAKVPDASGYEVFRSTQPVIPLLMGTMLTMETGANTSGADGNRWSDNTVAANTRYYYAVLAVTKTTSCSLVATGSAATPAQNQPLTGHSGSNPNREGEHVTTPSTTSRTEGRADLEAAERQAIRQKDGVTRIAQGQHAGTVPNSTYWFGADLDVGDGSSLAETDDGEFHDLFEIHKLADGRFALVGYVSADAVANLKQAKAGTRFTLYSRRWTGAPEIVSIRIPSGHLRMAGASSPGSGSDVVAGRYFSSWPARIEENHFRTMELEWK